MYDSSTLPRTRTSINEPSHRRLSVSTAAALANERAQWSSTGHRDGVALLSPWYSLIGEKRAWRHDFLKQLARAFDSDPSGKTVVSVSTKPARAPLMSAVGRCRLHAVPMRQPRYPGIQTSRGNHDDCPSPRRRDQLEHTFDFSSRASSAEAGLQPHQGRAALAAQRI